MGLILDMTPKNLEKVLYFSSYVVLESSIPAVKKKDVLTDAEYNKYREEFGEDSIEAGTFKKVGGTVRYRLLMNFSNLSFFDDHYSKDEDGNAIWDSSGQGVLGDMEPELRHDPLLQRLAGGLSLPRHDEGLHLLHAPGVLHADDAA